MARGSKSWQEDSGDLRDYHLVTLARLDTRVVDLSRSAMSVDIWKKGAQSAEIQGGSFE